MTPEARQRQDHADRAAMVSSWPGASLLGLDKAAVADIVVHGTITSSPGRQCTASAISLHMVPDGKKTAVSFCSRSATRRHSAFVVGSSPACSSPTSASAMAARIPALGRVRVSL